MGIKRIAIFIACHVLIQNAIYCRDNEEKKIKISRFCELLHQRIYIVERFAKTIHFLSKINSNNTLFLKDQCNIFMHVDDGVSFKHPQILALIEDIKNKQSISPFLLFWNSTIASFKKLNDRVLTHEIVQLSVAILRNVFVCLKPKKHVYITKYFTRIMDHPECITDVIDIFCTFRTDEFDDTIFTPHPSNFTYTEVMSQRLYCTNRLSGPIELLKRIPDEYIQKMFQTFALNAHLSNPSIIRCTHSMIAKKSLIPLFVVWNDFRTYRHIKCPRFEIELSRLVFSIFRIIMNDAHNGTDLLPHIQYVFNNLETLSLEEIIDAVTLIAEQLPDLLEKYELHSALTWTQWFKKYWWLPPLALSIIGIKVYFLIQRNRLAHALGNERIVT